MALSEFEPAQTEPLDRRYQRTSRVYDQVNVDSLSLESLVGSVFYVCLARAGFYGLSDVEARPDVFRELLGKLAGVGEEAIQQFVQAKDTLRDTQLGDTPVWRHADLPGSPYPRTYQYEAYAVSRGQRLSTFIMIAACSFETLLEINVDDLLNAWGLAEVRLGLGLWRALARPPSAEFARQMCRFDEIVGTAGLQAGGAALCRRYTGGVRGAGLEHVPREGPVLLLANHPGLCDTVALFATIARPDLRVIALDRPFLRALPHTSRYLDLLPDDVDGRAGVTRAIARHLRRGGAALTFPAGEIEPDPLSLPGATDSLGSWSESVGSFTRLVPQASIVVAMVGGVYDPSVLRHPLTRLRRRRADRELLAAALQLVWRRYQGHPIDVAFGSPLRAADLLAQDRDPARITRAVTDRARRVLENWPTSWETAVPGPGLGA